MTQPTEKILQIRYPLLVRRFVNGSPPYYTGLFSYEQIKSKWKALARQASDDGGKIRPGTQGKLIPSQGALKALIEEEYERLQLAPGQQKIFREQAERLFEPDAGTGASSAYLEPFDLMVLGDVTQPDPASPFYNLPIVRGRIDLSNLTGANRALSGALLTRGKKEDITGEGRAATDKMLHVILHHIKNAAAEAVEQGGYVVLRRLGGDEFSFIWVGVPEARIRVAEAQFEKSVKALVEEMGLADIMHAKHPGDPDRRGIWVGHAFERYAPGGKNPEAYLKAFEEALDRKVESEKKRRATDRATDLGRLHESRKGLSHHGLPAHRRFSEVPREDREGYVEKGLVIRLAEKEVEHAITTVERAHRELQTAEPEPKAALQTGEGFRWPSLSRRLAAIEAIKGLGRTGHALSPEQEDFFWRLFDLAEARDLATGFRQDSFAEAIDSVAESLRNYTDSKNEIPKSTALVFEMQNMGALNARLGHEGCNDLIGETAKIIEEHFEGTLHYRPGGRGDRLCLLVQGEDAETIAQTIGVLTEAVQAQAKKHPMLEALPGLWRFVAAAKQIEPGLENTTELLGEIDRQLERNAAEGVAFNGAAISVAEKAGAKRGIIPAEGLHVGRLARPTPRGKAL